MIAMLVDTDLEGRTSACQTTPTPIKHLYDVQRSRPRIHPFHNGAGKLFLTRLFDRVTERLSLLLTTNPLGVKAKAGEQTTRGVKTTPPLCRYASRDAY